MKGATNRADWGDGRGGLSVGRRGLTVHAAIQTEHAPFPLVETAEARRREGNCGDFWLHSLPHLHAQHRFRLERNA